jgi:2,3-bisphosphoglycerate-dependent phosphoglycerate mutase
MSKVLYLVRHCQAVGQHPQAPLSSEGLTQARALADRLAGGGIDRIVSSPFLRAVQSIAPLAERLGLPIETDARLREHLLSASDLPDWQDALQASFQDPDLCFEGGESSRAATDRVVAAVEEILAHAPRTTVVVTHGKLLTLQLRHFDPRVGFAEWQALRNPDVFCLKFGPNGPEVRRPLRDARITRMAQESGRFRWRHALSEGQRRS